MNAIKTLLAVSAVLAATSSAHAATYNFTASMYLPLYSGGTFLGTKTGVGTATLDDSTGVLDMTLSTNYNLSGFLSGATYIEHDVLNGTLTGSSYTYATGIQSASDCVPWGFLGQNICIVVRSPDLFLPDVNPIVFNFTSGGVTTFTTTDTEVASQGDLQTTTYTLTSPVPVPAAAWLFGSGLLGLAGVARRRAA